ncbi:MAG: hypothetical protein P1Q69_07405 [Candidatus Thorarchaeota archaeon]|nr:hypothetical protein [Candidatus Thorarchaeota archaeon]
MDAGPSGDIFTRSWDHITKWNNGGGEEWVINGYCDTMFALSDGALLTAENVFSGTTRFVKYDAQGEFEWSRNFSVTYGQHWDDYYEVLDFTESPNETIFILIGLYGFHPGRIILEMTTEGTILSNHTLAFSSELYQAYIIPQFRRISFSTDGLLYLFVHVIDDDWYYTVIVSVYGTEPFFYSTSNMTLLGSGLAAAITISTIAILQTKYQKSEYRKLVP